MSWLASLLPLTLGFLALRRRFLAVGWFLVARAGADLLRALLAPLREDFPRPYEGLHKTLWLLTDVAPFLTPPAVLLALLGRPLDASLVWLFAYAVVAVRYPLLRGDELLLRYYPAVYLTIYILAWAILTARIASRGSFDIDRMLASERDELALVSIIATSTASVVEVVHYGSDYWWSVWITNGVGYVAVLALVAAPPRV